MRVNQAIAVICLAVTTVAAQSGSTEAVQAAKSSSNSTAPQRPKSFDLDAMDKTVSPCEDFYQYACGTWRKDHPIPSDQTRWGRFTELAEYNRSLLHDILEKAAATDGVKDPIEQKIGDFYGSCMDEATVNKKGIEPIKADLDRISAISNKGQLIAAIGHLHTVGVRALFGFGSQPDLHNATMYIAGVIQGGLSLPDRDYYIKSDPKSTETRERYQTHVAKMLTLMGDEAGAAQEEAKTVLDIESKLAQAAWERTKMRDPKNRDHKMPVSQLESLAPNFEFKKFFDAAGAPAFSEVNVVPPDFFQQTNSLIDSVPLNNWKTYLRWHLVHSVAATLSQPFVDENFDFYDKYLNGRKELPVRWKRCVQLTDQLLGEALGQPYVQQTFGADGKQRTLKMVQALEAALSQDIKELPWMTSGTKKNAEVKLQAITNKIGYPDKWRDYSSVNITRGDLLGNVQHATVFEEKRQLNKIGKPLDKKEWGMTPPTVNAYYSAANNDINFPAGILQPPFFDKSVDDAVNFGGIGVVIGHELTHGFDDQGSKFDAVGNLRDWWTVTDRTEFDKRTGCVADEYSSFLAVDDMHLNGRLTLGENTADNGGVRIALRAYHNLNGSQTAKGKGDQEAEAQKNGGFTPEQRFFIGFAQIWCENRTPESARVLVLTDPHSPGRYRVNGTLQNNEDFAKAFSCHAGQKMVSQNACRVW
jgi:putative endopeptidase